MTDDERPRAGREPGLFCLVSPGRRLVGAPEAREEALATLIAAAIASGIDLIQIREPDLPAATLFRISAAAVAASRGTATRIVINDRLDVALAARADGVHLGARSLPLSRVRATVPPAFLVGRSVHGAAEARAIVEEGGADYLIAGTVFPSSSKPEATRWLGTTGLAEIVAAVPMPVLGIGGIDVERVEEVGRTGAAGVAAIGLFADPATLPATLRDARRLFDRGKAIP